MEKRCFLRVALIVKMGTRAPDGVAVERIIWHWALHTNDYRTSSPFTLRVHHFFAAICVTADSVGACDVEQKQYVICMHRLLD